MYTKITPKVGDKFRVIKDCYLTHSKPLRDGETIEIIDVQVSFFRYKGCCWFYETSQLTTEYLEPVEEAFTGLSPEQTEQMYKRDKTLYAELTEYREKQAVQFLPTKQTIMNKLSSGLKRALSKDKQTLYKAGLIGCDLELTNTGQSAYVDALFNNEGDHKKAVAEMVDMASEED